MFPVVLLQTAPAGTDLITYLLTNYGWKITLVILFSLLIIFVVKQVVKNNAIKIEASIRDEEREDQLRAEREQEINNLRARHEKLMDDVRMQMLAERNDAQTRVLGLMDSLQKLSSQFIEAQQQTIKFQNDLTLAKQREEAAVSKANILEEQVKQLQGDLADVQLRLSAAQQRIEALIYENKQLEADVQRLKTGSIPKIVVEES